jgi:hypothetical protein
MENITMINLVKEILAIIGKPVPKVRLAKLVYFSFKELVIQGYATSNAIGFIRMPLGPVPIGFTEELSKDPDVEITDANIGLTYNRISYSVKNGYEIPLSVYSDFLKSKLSLLQKFHTSTLVEKSHQDHTWKNLSNGEEFYISTEDMIPVSDTELEKSMTDEMDDQFLQSKLLKGMKREIVLDSSALEYPQFYSEDE